MGASIQSGGRGKRRMNADINVVPYIDVMLVLLIIFMITAPLMTQGVDVDLPDAQAESLTVPEDPPTLQILADGTYKLNGDVVDEAGLATRIQELRSEEHTSELQSLMRISYAVFCLKNKKQTN